MSVGRSGGSTGPLTKTVFSAFSQQSPQIDDGPLKYEDMVEWSPPPGYVAEIHRVTWTFFAAGEDVLDNITEYGNVFAAVGTGSLDITREDFQQASSSNAPPDIDSEDEDGWLDSCIGMLLHPGSNGTAPTTMGHPFQYSGEWEAGAGGHTVNVSSQQPIAIDAVINLRNQDSVQEAQCFFQASMTITYSLRFDN
jgi:hypothetical protein